MGSLRITPSTSGPLSLAALLLFCLFCLKRGADGLNCNAEPEEVPFGEEEQLDWELEEFRQFCKNLAHQRTDADAQEMAAEALCTEEVFDHANLRMLFVLMLMFAYGAFVRTVLRVLKVNVPYTVILMLSGLLLGFLSKKYCDVLSSYTAIARIPPKIILFTFLPILIFESAFSITPHTFIRMMAQILIVALPGMVIATFMTALVVNQFLYEYKWDILESSLFGSIISATDPVAVVAILRELGTSEMLSVMIEGESLLNDGIAILLYEILEEIITCQVHENLGVFILKKFGQITLGGPVFGFFMGKVAVFCLSLIFNDSTVEITITLVSAYLTYYIGEDILGVSGVMAVVVLGITMGSERTSISPEVENFVHHFWEMLGYFANTVLFMIVGIVITETAVNNLTLLDWVFLLFLYIMLNIVRLAMLLIMFPLISRIGYGLTWQNMIVMMWGGLRGAVGICLALDVYDNKHLCQTNLGPKFLFQTAGIVFLTLVVNGTTTKMLLAVLKLTEISSGRIQDMANAMKQLELAQYRTINMLKHDRFVADANWSFVDKYTTISNPYAKAKVADKDLQASQSLVSIKGGAEDHHTECPECHTLVQNEPTTAEYTEMTEEARLRVLKALKVSFWRQFEQGVLIELAVLQLVAVASATEDKPLRLVHAHDLRKHWTIRGCLPWMKTKFIKTFGLEEEILPPKPTNGFRKVLWWIATRDWFDYLIIFIIMLNMIPAIWDTVLLARDGPNPPPTPESSRREKAFFYSSVAFNMIYLLEMLIKVIGRGPRDYFWVNKFNYIDIVVLLLGFVDMILYLNNVKFSSAFVFVKIFRVVRAVRLLRPLVPRFMRFVDGRINRKLFLGYDVGKGFVTAVDDVIKYLPQMVDNPKVLHKLKHVLERERLETVREMGIMSKDHPGIAIAVKTHHASRAVLNQMKEALTELKEDGLVDEKECEILTIKLEENMKKLWKAPPSIAPAPPEALLQNVSWIVGSIELYHFLHERAELISFAFGDTLCRAGDVSVGIYVITSGLVKVHYIPSEGVVAKFDQEGELPNMELFVDLTFRSKEDDFFSTGTVIGEQGVLTGQGRAAAVKCETSVFAYYIPQTSMREALRNFSEPCLSLEGRMWRAVGVRLALALLPKHPNYSTWGADKIRLHCERSFVPTSADFDTLVATDFIAEILVITGRVKDFHSDDVYFAPQLVPRSVSKMTLIHATNIKTRVLLIANEDIEPPGEDDEGHELYKCYQLATEFIQRSKMEDRSASDLNRRYSEQLKFGVRRKQKREMSKKDGRREGFPKEITKKKKVGDDG